MTTQDWPRHVIERRVGEAVRVTGPARIELLEVIDHRVRLAVDAPPETNVSREPRQR